MVMVTVMLFTNRERNLRVFLKRKTAVRSLGNSELNLADILDQKEDSKEDPDPNSPRERMKVKVQRLKDNKADITLSSLTKIVIYYEQVKW